MTIRVDMRKKPIETLYRNVGLYRIRENFNNPLTYNSVAHSFREGFITRMKEGHNSPYYYGTGRPYKPLARVTKYVRKVGWHVSEWPPLFATGQMVKSFTLRIRRALNTVFIILGPTGNRNRILSSLHEFGGESVTIDPFTKSKKKVMIPSRPFIGFEKREVRGLVKLFARLVLKGTLFLHHHRIVIRAKGVALLRK